MQLFSFHNQPTSDKLKTCHYIFKYFLEICHKEKLVVKYEFIFHTFLNECTQFVLYGILYIYLYVTVALSGLSAL